jgi:hypothetical protein
MLNLQIQGNIFFVIIFLILMYFNNFKSNRFILKKLGTGIFFLHYILYDV